MTLTIKETGLRHKCFGCLVRTVAAEHNGMLLLKVGKRSVFAPSLSIQCDCGYWNHISLIEKADVVR